MSLVLEGEMIYDLQCKGLHIIQDKKGYCFTTDSVLLANFVKMKSKDKACEFCSGSGVISVLASAKNNFKSIDLVELQPRLADMSKRSIELNKLEDKLVVYNMSFQEFAKQNPEKYDVLFSNPPYISSAGADKNLSEEIRIARHEIAMNMQDFAMSISKTLKYGGKFFIVHKAERFDEIMLSFAKYNLAIKNVIFCHPKDNKNASFVLFEGLKGGKNGLKVLPPLILNDQDGEISARVRAIYNAGEKL